ncbi:efflux RND transporter periplasmic adaptor subunit [Pseudomonas panipatensis]|uniref:RND family efflux transporter, MFP subunit n=1 Tax=Pseudomonas panipatensis TaxID=428992 RepID=A0A1G8MNY7_9PSED|nr:efflux RND transporter periplasmic adaptor subunit [Pseudomonas panipatensis]SDI69525.1 RND family efflux transporter, MFP subunit [Pseudomonas panipatensis]SMP77626.1 RND family efflux transporter, MFP subunit [Pseudomonas panipatensis]
MPIERPRPRTLLIGSLSLGLLAVLVGGGLALRAGHAHAVAKWTEAEALPVVRTFHPAAAGQANDLNLPAHLEAWQEAAIHARVSGYLKAWHSDIGASVKTGQVLAVIDTPDLDQQLQQARARLQQARANAHLAQTTAVRWQNLLASHSVARQEADEKQANAEAARANVAAAEADCARLESLEAYKTLQAPFDGVLTARHTDVGELIQADSASGAELFRVADTRRLRLYVPVPQNYASAIRPGLEVSFSVPEHPGRLFHARYSGSSTAVDSRSGSLLAEFDVANPDAALLPGDYAEAHLPLPKDEARLSIPSSALIFRAKGTQVALLDGHGRVHLQAVHIALDLGDRLQIDQGLKASDQVIDNPPDSLANGDEVRESDGGEHARQA